MKITADMKQVVNFELDSKEYKIIHKMIGTLVDECRLVFDENGLHIAVVDPANVSMLRIEIKKDMFVKYKLKSKLEIGFDIDALEKRGVLKKTNNGTIEFTIFEAEGITNEKRYVCKVHHDIFTDVIDLPSVNHIRAEPKIPNIDYKSIFQIDKLLLLKVANRCEGLKIMCVNSKISFDNTEDGWCTDEIQVDDTEDSTSIYSTNYLVDIIKSIPVGIVIDFGFSSDYPCKIKVDYLDRFTSEWLLAPRIEHD